MTGTVVVVGSSIGGVRTAQALRSEGYDGRVVLVGEESELPYDKPPLSKQFLSGDWTHEKVVLLTREAAEEHGIELRLGSRATRLDVAAHRVLLADGEALSYDSLVIATGASARPSPWRPESGVHGPEIGRLFSELHHRHGVETRFGVGVDEVSGRAGDLQVGLTDGSRLTGATVVVGIGAVPNDGWLADSGLPIENGVLCDEYSRALDAPEVFAIGDVARWFHPGRREHVRVEHWTNAVEQGVCAAHNIAHPDDLRSYRPVEYVWSDQYDWKAQIVGRPVHGVRQEVVGTLEGERPKGAVLYADDAGRLCGAVTVNWSKALVQCRRLVAQAAPYDDALVRLRELGPVAAPAAGS